MPDPELSINDLESVLNQMQLEVTQKLNEQRTLKYIQSVIVTYRKMMSEMGGLDAKKKALEKAISALQGQHDTALAGHTRDVSSSRAAADAELLTIKTKLDTARQALADLNSQVKDKERFAKKRLDELDASLKQKQTALDAINTDLEAVRKKHGIA